MSLIEKRNLDEQVSDWVWSGIVEQKFRPGKVLKDTRVGSETGVSRSTARAALNRLAEELPIIRKIHGGWQVCAVSADDAIEMYSLRSALECMAAELLCSRINDAGRAELLGSVARLRLKLDAGGRREIAEADLAIHKKIVELTGHKRLIEHYNRVLQSTLAYVMLTNKKMGGMESMTNAHAKLVAAINEGDTEEAIRLTREHLLIAQSSVIESLQNTSIDESG